MSRAVPARLSPALAMAQRGALPTWAVAEPPRQAHIARVAALLDAWADSLRIADDERARWRAAAWLHDALRDAPARELRSLVDPPLDTLPPQLLHGAAAARRLAEEGVRDDTLLHAIAYHPIGHSAFGRLGRMLYAADFLEPGRTFLVTERAALRARMPHDDSEVLPSIVRLRIANLLDGGVPIRPETIAFWNTLAGERARAREA